MKARGAFVGIADALALHALERPSATAFTYLIDGEQKTESLSFRELYRRACAVAGQIAERRPGAERALVLQAPGLDYVISLSACFIAGVAAIPTPLPAARVERTSAQRFQRLVRDASPEVVLTHTALQPLLSRVMTLEGDVGGRVCICTDALGASEGRAPESGTPETGALIQYTSGSTGDPKGVLIDHGNLAANLAAIAEKFELTRDSVVVNWLPPFHDMGLVGGILEAVWAGYHVVLMDPKHFISRPLRWLEAIERFNADVSGGANFAYDLCANAIAKAENLSLDLSRWRLAYSGAEPVRATSIDRFSRAFAPFGFRRQAFYPCYGLAEATLMATGADPGATRPIVTPFKASDMEQGRAIPAGDGAGGHEDVRSLVSCGTPCAGTVVEIADPESGKRLEDGRIGEIWISGPGVFRGYRRGGDDAPETDGVLSTYSGQAFFRTGDLGFQHDGALYVAGRLKDMMIFHGRNHFPNDIEDTAVVSHPAISPHGVAAFSMDTWQEEVLVVACEIRREYRKHGDWTEVFTAVRRAVTAQSGVAPAEIILLMPGALPRTTSGKIRRSACRSSYAANDWAVIARGSDHAASDDIGARYPDPLFLTDGKDEKLAHLPDYLKGRLAELTSLPAAFITDESELGSLGMDSLKQVELGLLIEQDLGVVLPNDWADPGKTVEALAMLIQSLTSTEDPQQSSEARARPEERTEGPFAVTPMQRAFLEDETKDPDGFLEILYFRTPVGLDAAALETAITALNGFHDAFSLRFEKCADAWTCRYREPAGDGRLQRIQIGSAGGTSIAAVRDTTIATLISTISIENGSLVSAALLDRGPMEHGLLIVAFHHLVVDAVSLSIWATQLQEAYARAKSGLSPMPKRARPLFGSWLKALDRHGRSDAVSDEVDYWTRVCGPATGSFADAPTDDAGGHHALPMETLTGAQSRILLERFASPIDRQALFLAAFSRAAAEHLGSRSPLILVENNGRCPFPNTDPHRAIGWFVSQYPVRIDTQSGGAPFSDYEGARQSLLTVPNAGVGYGLLLSRPRSDPVRNSMESLARPDFYFQYRGNIEDTFRRNATFPVVGIRNLLEPSRGSQSKSSITQSMCLVAVVSRGKLSWSLAFHAPALENQVKSLSDGIRRFLSVIAESDDR
tara:strand:- start:4065 stop:7481 length:3417 start_codon:yes stop_codon:yes gene_type:complete